MKMQKSYINRDESHQWKQTYLHKKKITQVLCPEGNKATLACFSKDCASPAFACLQEKCSCQKAHQQCSMKKCNIIIKKLEQKIINFQPIIEETNKIISQKILYFQEIIDKLFIQQAELTEYLVEALDLFGMTQAQKIIYQNIIQKKTNTILGKNMYTNEKQIFSDISNVLQIQIKKTREFWNQPLTDLNQLSNKINEFKNKHMRNNGYMLFDSKIINTFKQKTYLNANFQSKIKDMKLLYNVQKRFQLQDFKIKCNDSCNTLILIQTENKKIGCFTDVKWKQVNLPRSILSKTLLISFTEQLRIVQGIYNDFNRYGDKQGNIIKKKQPKNNGNQPLQKQPTSIYQNPCFKNFQNKTLLIKQNTIFCDFKIFKKRFDYLCGKIQQPILQLEVWQILFQK